MQASCLHECCALCHGGHHPCNSGSYAMRMWGSAHLVHAGLGEASLKHLVIVHHVVLRLRCIVHLRSAGV